MDIAQLARDVATFLIPLLPFLSKAGETMAEEAGKNLVGAAWDKAKSMWARLKPKVDANPAALAVVKRAENKPDDGRVKGALELELEEMLSGDGEFAKQIAELLEEAKAAGGIKQNVTGNRNVTIGGSVSGSTIITGDKNKAG